jgi:hypothetical protein
MKMDKRRKHKRYQIQDGGFVMLRNPFKILGQIVDINAIGLSFSYSFSEIVAPESFELDMVFIDSGFYLFRVPFDTVYDHQISREIRRCGVLFRKLTEKQLFVIGSFINIYFKSH